MVDQAKKSLLGRWAVIDLETTGADPMQDEIIDVGYLQFEGTKLVKTYDSLVRYEEGLSQFIQKLTGISDKMVKRAPLWAVVEPEVMELYGHHLLAHNAEFEKSFLSDHFKKLAVTADSDSQREQYEDSLLFLALAFPEKSSLKLESYLVEWGIADEELHRGLSDAVDLLKTLLVACGLLAHDREKLQALKSVISRVGIKDWWYAKFLELDYADLQEIAGEIDFDLELAVERAKSLRLKATTLDLTRSPVKDFTFSGGNIRAILKDEAGIQQVLPFYRYRESQEELALKVGQGFKNHVHALVQAPTGTGKTLGYMLPAALFALEEKAQVLIATGTKTLQEQAMNKDVPKLRELTGLGENELKIARLIGSSNHLCELLFRQEQNEDDLLGSARAFEERFSTAYFEMAFFHNARSDVKDALVRGELPYVLKRKFKSFDELDKRVAVDFRSCTGQRCPFKNECSYIRGLREAREAHIIVGNHALMYAWPRGFARPQYIIVDEAHKLEGETTSSFSAEVSKEALEVLHKSLVHLQGVGSLFYLLAQNETEPGESTPIIKQIRDESTRIAGSLYDQLYGLEDSIQNYFRKMPRYTSEYWNELPMVSRERSGDPLAVALYNRFDSIRHILGQLHELLLPYSARYDVSKLDDDNMVIAVTRFETFFGSVEDLNLALNISLDQKEGFGHAFRYHEREGYNLISSPIDVGKVTHDGLLQTSASVIFTSATLANAQGDLGARGIEWALGYTYLDAARRFKSGFYLPATYDYKNKTKVYLCDDTPALYDSRFVPQVLKEVGEVVKKLEGRSLFLFSAKKRFEEAREYLLKEFEGKLPVFIQGMGSHVVEDFRASGRGILLGMESFGEGIDIPGDALQFVFIDKVPDLRMDLVIQKRRDFYDATLGSEFSDYYLAHRTRALHQKLGRLLRTESDYGGVIIVDSRVKGWKGATMQKMMKLMEPYQVERTTLKVACSGVVDFIENHP